MHFFPDTGDADAAAESFWAENFKQVIREDFRQHVGTLFEGRTLSHIYAQQYSLEYNSLKQFTDKLADMVTIGAENGTDAAFDDIYTAFLTESPLPQLRKYAVCFLPQAVPAGMQRKIQRAIATEYREERVFRYAYKVGYQNGYDSFDKFIGQAARLVTTGAVTGADDMLGRIYRSFMTRCPLPPARRYPKRLKSW